jgi:hypothetical protein
MRFMTHNQETHAAPPPSNRRVSGRSPITVSYWIEASVVLLSIAPGIRIAVSHGADT